jgi:hypothetical protein
MSIKETRCIIILLLLLFMLSNTKNMNELRVQLRHSHTGAGLPDGLFSNQNPNLGKFLRALD